MEGIEPCCGCEPGAQELCGPHDRLEVVHVEGRDILRRAGTDPCPAHVAAILRARAYSGRDSWVLRAGAVVEEHG